MVALLVGAVLTMSDKGKGKVARGVLGTASSKEDVMAVSVRARACVCVFARLIRRPLPVPVSRP